MARIEYHKLVRDRIPEIIRAAGGDCRTRVLADAEYVAALLAKAQEEIAELAAAPAGERIVEFGDVHEVLDALLAAWGIDRAAVAEIQTRRRAERGGFRERVLLEWADDRDARGTAAGSDVGTPGETRREP